MFFGYLGLFPTFSVQVMADISQKEIRDLLHNLAPPDFQDADDDVDVIIVGCGYYECFDDPMQFVKELPMMLLKA